MSPKPGMGADQTRTFFTAAIASPTVEHVPSSHVWALILRDVLDWTNDAVLEIVNMRVENSSVLRSVFGKEISRHITTDEKRPLELEQGSTIDADSRDSLDKVSIGMIIERISVLLDSFEEGDTDSWWKMSLELIRGPGRVHFGGDFWPDLTALGGWNVLPANVQDRVIRTALRYIEIGDPKSDIPIVEGQYTYAELAGYKALRLVASLAQSELPGVSAEAWRKWSRIIIRFPFSVSPTDQDITLVTTALEEAQNEVLSVLVDSIEVANKNSRYPMVIQRIEDCFNDAIANRLLDLLAVGALEGESLRSIVKLITKNRPEMANRIVEVLLDGPDHINKQEKNERKLVIAQVFWEVLDQSPWEFIWPIIGADRATAEELIQRISTIISDSDSFNRLEENQLKDLYLLVTDIFPHDEDPESSDRIHKRAEIGIWRDSIITNLENRGTRESVQTIEDLCSSLGHVRGLKYALSRARSNYSNRIWTPRKADELFIHSNIESEDFRLRKYMSRYWDCVFQIEAEKDGLTSGGTCFLLSEGLIVTCKHNIASGRYKIILTEDSIATQDDVVEYPHLIEDIAILSIVNEDFTEFLSESAGISIEKSDRDLQQLERLLSMALVHGCCSSADLDPPIHCSRHPIAVWHSKLGHRVEDLAADSRFLTLTSQATGSHLPSDDGFVPINRILNHASSVDAGMSIPMPSAMAVNFSDMPVAVLQCWLTL